MGMVAKNFLANSRAEVPPPMGVSQYVAAFFERLDVYRFVLEVRLNGQEILFQLDHRRVLTVCNGCVCCWIHF